MAVVRLELACGHTAFAAGDEERRAGWARFCHPCDRYVKIADAAELAPLSRR